MITITPTTANVKFGETVKFSASEPCTFKIEQDRHGSKIDEFSGEFCAGHPETQEWAQDIVSAYAKDSSHGHVSATVTISKEGVVDDKAHSSPLTKSGAPSLEVEKTAPFSTVHKVPTK
jgi:hypothetical protein